MLPWVTERSIRSGFGSTSSDSEATGSSESDFTGFLSTTAARAFCARSRLVGGLDLVLTPDQASLIRGRIYNRAKKAQGGDSGNQYTEPKRHSDALAPPQKTSERLADDLGVSPRTVERDGVFASAVDRLRDVAPELETDIARGEAPPRKTRKTSSE